MKITDGGPTMGEVFPAMAKAGFHSERGPIFDAAREAYEAAQTLLTDLIDNPQAGGTVDEYRAMLKLAQRVSNDAHRKMMEAWK